MKKTVSEATDSVANGDDDSQIDDSSKKKRGRPPKPEGSVKKAKVEEPADGVKRKRGRPRKEGGSAPKPPKKPTLGPDGQPRRGRGRPKKGETAAGLAAAQKRAAEEGNDESS